MIQQTAVEKPHINDLIHTNSKDTNPLLAVLQIMDYPGVQ